jgi:isopenicillin N synthase-like dioxygenase
MTNTTSGAGLQIQPDVIPQLQSSFKAAADIVEQLAAKAQGAMLTAPAMGDPPSNAFKEAFSSAVQQHQTQLTAFQQRLRQVIQSLGETQQAYNQHEQATAQNMTSRLGS